MEGWRCTAAGEKNDKDDDDDDGGWNPTDEKNGFLRRSKNRKGKDDEDDESGFELL